MALVGKRSDVSRNDRILIGKIFACRSNWISTQSFSNKFDRYSTNSDLFQSEQLSHPSMYLSQCYQIFQFSMLFNFVFGVIIPTAVSRQLMSLILNVFNYNVMVYLRSFFNNWVDATSIQRTFRPRWNQQKNRQCSCVDPKYLNGLLLLIYCYETLKSFKILRSSITYYFFVP